MILLKDPAKEPPEITIIMIKIFSKTNIVSIPEK